MGSLWVLGFHPQSKDMLISVMGNSKLAVGVNVRVNA